MRHFRAVTDATTMQRIERLRSVPIFAELDDEGLSSILACATEFDAPAGHVLAEAGMAGAGLFVIEEGTVVVEVPEHHRELGPGEFFGELSLLLPDTPRVARVRTKTTARCLALSRHDFERLLESQPKMALAMLRVLARRILDPGH
ncbi:MAG: cyclic nucleotide-binding domain-containing protein [Actinomycetota bacterium]